MAEVPEARPSSTVILAREAETAPEFLMVQREPSASFGGAYVFPGGVVDADDAEVARFSDCLSTSEADQILGLGEGGISYFSAAVRELFEETGILLARANKTMFDLRRDRQDLLDGQLGWLEFLERYDCCLDCNCLHYVSFWITPNALPKRYSTRFFVASLTDNQEAVHCRGELTDSRWMTAAGALAAADNKDIKLHFPTRVTLQGLAEHTSVETLLDWARQRAAEGVPCIHPELPDAEAVRRALGADDAGRLS